VSQVIVTGASSQIGVFLLPRLAASGHRVLAISRQAADHDDGVSWLRGDITDDFRWPQGEALVHIAPLVLLPEMLPGFAAAGGRRVVCFSTTSRHSKAKSDDPRERAFAAHVDAAERQVAARCGELGLRWTLFRPTLIYGCERDRNVTLIARTIRRFGFFPLLGQARGLRQPVHADDLAAACAAVLDGQAPQYLDKTYDLVGGETLEYREMVRRIFIALGRRPRFLVLPQAAFAVALRMLALLPRFRDFSPQMARRMGVDLVFDAAAAANDFGYAPRPFQPEFPGLLGLKKTERV